MNQQMTIEEAIHKGQMAALAAAKNADSEMDGWSTEAATLFLEYARDVARGEPFLVEDARVWAESKGLPSPPSKRAWGHIPKALRALGRVVSNGYGRTKMSNGCMVAKWQLV